MKLLKTMFCIVSIFFLINCTSDPQHIEENIKYCDNDYSSNLDSISSTVEENKQFIGNWYINDKIINTAFIGDNVTFKATLSSDSYLDGKPSFIWLVYQKDYDFYMYKDFSESSINIIDGAITIPFIIPDLSEQDKESLQFPIETNFIIITYNGREFNWNNFPILHINK